MMEQLDADCTLYQLVAYGNQNTLYEIGLRYALNLAEIEMVLKQDNPNSNPNHYEHKCCEIYNKKKIQNIKIDLTNDECVEQFDLTNDECDEQFDLTNDECVKQVQIQNHNRYEYECEMKKIADQFKIQGVIIDLDEQIECSNPIENELHKMILEIYTYGKDENGNKLEDKINLVGSIPLIIGKISNISNSVVIKLPNTFFSSETKYFNCIVDYKFVIKSPIKFKKIFLENIVRYCDLYERRNIADISNIFYEQDWKYIVSSPLDFEAKKNLKLNQIVCEKKLSNTKEKILGLYFVITEEFVKFISHIEFKFKTYNKIIDLDVLETIYKIEEKGYVNLYGISFQQPLDLEPTDIVKIKFNCGKGNKDDDLIYTQINNIFIYPFVSNKLTCVKYNLKLKFVDGELNKTFNENEKATINKFSDNTVELINAMCEFQKEKNKEKKNYNAQFVLRFI